MISGRFDIQHLIKTEKTNLEKLKLLCKHPDSALRVQAEKDLATMKKSIGSTQKAIKSICILKLELISLAEEFDAKSQGLFIKICYFAYIAVQKEIRDLEIEKFIEQEFESLLTYYHKFVR